MKYQQFYVQVRFVSSSTDVSQYNIVPQNIKSKDSAVQKPQIQTVRLF